MRTLALIAGLAALTVGATAGAKPDAGFAKVAARIRAAFEQQQQMPLEADLYADKLFVDHNYEPGRIVNAAEFIQGVTRELAAAKKVGSNRKAEVTRILEAPEQNTVVTTVRMTGELADGTKTDFSIAYFFEVENGRVKHLQTWYDRKGNEAQTAAIQSEMKK